MVAHGVSPSSLAHKTGLFIYLFIIIIIIIINLIAYIYIVKMRETQIKIPN